MPSLKDLANIALDYGPALAGPVASGLINRNAAGDATRKLDEGAARAESVIQPYASAGQTALAKASNFGLDELMKDPGMQFRMSEGMKLLERNQASGGSLNSGAAWKAKQRYAQDIASQEYGNAWNRNMQMIGVGQRGADQLVNLISARAEALANGDIAKANALTEMIGGIQGGIEGVQDKNTLQRILGGAGSILGGGGGSPSAGDWTRLPIPGMGDIAGIGGTPPFVPGATTFPNTTGLPTGVEGGGLGQIGSTLGKVGGAIGAGAMKGLGAVAGAIGSIPVAGQIALGVAGAALLAKKVFGIGNTHTYADKLTGEGGIQSNFNKGLEEIVRMEQSGEISHDQRLEAIRVAYDDLRKKAAEFSAKGNDQTKVANQMLMHYLTNPVTMEALI